MQISQSTIAQHPSKMKIRSKISLQKSPLLLKDFPVKFHYLREQQGNLNI